MSTYFIGDSDQPLDNSLPDQLHDDGTSAAQLDVIHDYVGNVDHSLSVQDANYLALANGWWHPPTADSGMVDAGHLLDAYGVPNHHVEGGDIQQLLSELDSGHQVIVGLHEPHGAESGSMHELHQFLGEKLGFDPLSEGSQHTVTVKGVDRSDPDHPQVMIHDAAHGDAATTNYPLSKFEEALDGQNVSYLATNARPGEQHIEQPHHHHLISDVVGLGTTALAMHLGDPTIALAAGKLADVATDKMWDSILAYI